MKILFIVPYPISTAPSQRLKFEQYFDYFKENGIEIEFSPFISESFRKILYKEGYVINKVLFTIFGYLKRMKDIFKAIKCDIVYIHLEAAPFGPPIFEYIFYKLRKPIIYDMDDLVYLPHASAANKFVKFLRYPQKVSWIMKISSHIIVVTKYLRDFAKKYNENVTYIPPTIDTNRYYIKDKKDGKKICIGWTGSYSTSRYLLLLKNVLKRISQRYNVEIKVIGDENFDMDGIAITAKAWSADTEVSDIHEIDIGLYSLPKDEWIMGKGGLKALQYMGMGIPVVCTRVGAVLDFIQDYVNGFLADSEEEWIEKISRLIENTDLRKRIGLAGRKTVEEAFSVKLYAPIYLNIIKETANNRNVKYE